MSAPPLAGVGFGSSFLSSFQAATRSLAARSPSCCYVRPPVTLSSSASASASASRRCFFSSAWHSSPSPLPRRHSESAGLSHALPQLQPQWQQSPLRLSHRAGSRGFKILPGHVVFTHYVDLPPNYRDEVGLHFRRSELDAKETAQVFGRGVTPLAANRLLRILHGRRVAGTLDDPALRRNTASYSREQQAKALAWLRRNITVDEITNAGLRAEDELRALEARENGELEEIKNNKDAEEGDGEEGKRKKMLDYGSRFKIYQDRDPEPEAEAAASSSEADSVYGRGAFDTIRARNQAKWEAEQKRREAERLKREEEEALKNPGGLQTIDPNQATRQPSVRMQKYLEEGTDLSELPEMTRTERILPSAIIVALIVAVFVAYAEYYRPPAPHQRLYPDVSPATATLGVLVGLNVACYLLWKVPPLWRVMNRYFQVTPGYPRPISILGAMFSHQTIGHLANNCFWLWLVGVRFHEDVGRANFLATYFAAGSLGFLGSLAFYVLRGQLTVATMGLSGAGYGVMTAFFWMHRYDGFKILNLPPDPYNGIQGLGFVGLMLALNLSALMSAAPKAMMLDIVSHLIGMATGVVAATLLERKKEQLKMRADEELRRQEEAGGAMRLNMGLLGDVMEKLLAWKK